MIESANRMRPRSVLQRVRRGVVVVAAAICLVEFTAGWLLLSPARRVISMPPGLAMTRETIRSGDGTSLGVWLHDVREARATVVLAHGLRSDPLHWSALVPRLTRAGFRSLALEFRAHGQSGGGAISFGAREREDVLAAMAHARTYGAPVLFVGFSMGAASYLLSGQEAAAAVLDSPYDTLPHALRARWSATHLPVFMAVPTYLGLWARMPIAPDALRPIDRVRALTHPTRFVFAERDHWVPASSQARFRAALCPSCSVDFIPARGHGDHADDAWAGRVTGFLNESVSGDRSSR